MGLAANEGRSFHYCCGRYTAQSPDTRLLTKLLQSKVEWRERERERERGEKRNRMNHECISNVYIYIHCDLITLHTKGRKDEDN